MKTFRLSIPLALSIGLGVIVGVGVPVRGHPGIADERRPDLAMMFRGNYHQEIDQFGTVSRTALDASGRVIGVQIGTYRPGDPNGMTIEMTYLEPDAEHPRGQAFDGAGNPTPVH
jgi:hypothetical protein